MVLVTIMSLMKASHPCLWIQICQYQMVKLHIKVSIVRKYHNHILQTKPREREEKPHNPNSHKTLISMIDKVKQSALSSS